MTADFSTMPPEASSLVIQLMQASQAQTAGITTSLIESLTEQLADSQAKVDAIRTRIQLLLEEQYMPTPDAIRRALWPSAEVRAAFRQDEEN